MVWTIFSLGAPGNSLPPNVLTFVTAPKIQIHGNFDGCTSKFFSFSLSASFLAVRLCKIPESRWVFLKSVHRYNVLIFLTQSVRALTVLIDVLHVKSGRALSFPVCCNKIKSGKFFEILWAFLIKQLLTRACWIGDDYSQLGATRLVGSLPSHIQRALVEYR